MDHQHYRTTNDDDDDEELVVNNKNILEKLTDDDNEEGLEEKKIKCKRNILLYFLDNHELSITPIPESINDEDGNTDQIDCSKLQVKI
jgi:hypothetical protein